MRVAIIHDWLTEMGGAEKVFRAILDLFPDADIYTLVYNEDVLSKLSISKDKVNVSFIQYMPFAKKKYRNYLPLFKYAIESFDLSKYDIVISSSYCVAKGVMTSSSQLHISYCHSPVRYAWDLYHQYLVESKLTSGIKSMFVKYVLHRLRIWDVVSSNRVDIFIANSNYIRNRIKKVYRREAETIYPNVDVKLFPFVANKDDYYFTCSRFVPYKKIDLIVKAFNEIPDRRLIVIGDGPDFDKVKNVAGDNVTLMGYQTFDVLKDKLSHARAFIFAAEEDFGIAPVEAQACGTPVLAFGKGGGLETVIENITGLFFNEQSTDAIVKCIKEFEIKEDTFDKKIIREHAFRFSEENFKNQFSSLIQKYKSY